MPGRSESDRTRQLLQAVEALAGGDYSVRVPVAGENDRLAPVIRSINRIAQRMDEWEAASRIAEPERELTRLFLDRSSVGVARVAADARILSVNEQLCRSLGYSRDELCAMTVCELDPGFPPERWAGHIHSLRAGGSFTLETRLRRKDGTLFAAEVTPTFVEYQGEEYVIAFLRDITDRKRAEQSLRRAQAALDRARDPVYWVASDGSFFYVNDAACVSTGYGREELLRKSVFDIDPNFSRESWPGHWRRTRETGTHLVETFHRTREGRFFPVEVGVSHISFGDEEFHSALVRDITDQRQAEAQLRDSEARLRLALMAANQGLYDLNVQTGEATVTPEYARMLGYDPAEFRETNAFWIERLHPDDREPVAGTYRAYVQGEIPLYSVEFRQRTRMGEWKWILSMGKIVAWDAEGRPLRMLGTHTDITGRKRVEASLRENEYFLRKSQEVAHLGSYSMDIAAGTWISSHMLDEIFGIGEGYPKDVHGWLDIVAPDLREEMRDYLERFVIKGGHRFDKEYRIIRQNDRAERWVHGLGELEKDQQGVAVRMIGTIQDVTDRVLAEEEREALEAQLRQAQKMESIGRLAGGVAHDFNNMLAVILGYSELIRLRLPAGDPLLKSVREIEKAASHSRDVTRQLLAFSRKQIIAPKAVSLNDLLAVTKKTLSRLIGEDIDLAFRSEPELWTVRVDPSQFDQVLVNLAVNARDAMPEGGRLTLETGNVHFDEKYCREHPGVVPGDYVLLGVSDNGAGMDQETVSHIFEPFFTTKEVGKGTGLGLSTVYGIVQQNGGFIDVCSEPGEGTTFKIYIPRLVGSEGTEDESGEATPGVAETGSGTILLVEDDSMVRNMTARMLEEIGYNVFAAETPFDAIAVCEKEDVPLDLLITDVVMPGMNGRELWKHVVSRRPGIGVLFMSGYTPDVVAHRGILEDGVLFLHKPFTGRTLAQKVREAIGRR